MKNFMNTLLLVNGLLMLSAGFTALTSCRRDNNGVGLPSDANTPAQRDSLTATVPLPARNYINAVNLNNLDSLVAAFAPTGTVVDVSRRIEGREAVRTWARNEVMGGRLQVLRADQQQPDRVRLLVHWAPRGSTGWRAYYTFTYANGLVTLADLQYA
ncbi:nuclear transport factor 2 family protein [Spirosoma arcticum]